MYSKVINSTYGQLLGLKIDDYKQLVKLRLNFLVVFSALLTYLIAVNEINYRVILFLSVGGFLVTGASNAINQVLEKDFDKLMKRTMNRPLAANRMNVSEAILAAGFMSLIGITLLAYINPICAVFGTLSLIVYSFIYTPLKRVSPIAVLIGAIPGALPTAIGAVAAEGYVSPMCFAIFGIQFFWQFPHFWSIAWLGHEDYTKAGFKLIPNTTGELNNRIGFHSLMYSLPLFIITCLPFYFNYSGIYSLIIIQIVNIFYSFYSWKLYMNNDAISARKLMFSSFIYLPIVLIVYLIDKI
ncbi:MAG: protoheme IX farnesyltransferase [Saprospiraceae bacterium]|nr:protoheme IX farnesyltransferase [Saprospiraceae bacterium]